MARSTITYQRTMNMDALIETMRGDIAKDSISRPGDFRVSRKDFLGEPYQVAMERIINGYPQGRNDLSRDLETAHKLTDNLRAPCVSMDVAGAYPDVPLAIAGDPLNMVNFGDDYTATRPVLRLFCEECVSGAVEGQTIATRGAAILSQIDAMETVGIRCELVLSYRFCTDSNGKHYQGNFDCLVKEAHEPLSLDRLSGMLGRKEVLRRVVFHHIACTDHPALCALAAAHGLGSVASASQRKMERGVILIPSANENTWHYGNMKSAMSHIGDLISQGLAELGHDTRHDWRGETRD